MERDVSVRIGKYVVDRYSRRAYAIWDSDGVLIAVTLYKKGALEVARRLALKGERSHVSR